MFEKITCRTALGAALLLCVAITPTVHGQSPQRELVLLTWSEYLDPELVEKFEQQHNVRFREIYYETDDLRDQMMIETDGTAADLVIVNGAMLNTYRKRGWLAKAGIEQIPNLKHVDSKWSRAFEGAEGHAVPYFWGTLGIAYREDLVKAPPQSWMDLFRPAEEFHGKIAMVDSQRDFLGMALKALGYSANSSDSREINEATELLLAQRPFVKSYNYMVLDEDSAIVKGDVAMAMMFSGDALLVQEQDEHIKYVVPREGGNLWVDYLVAMESSNNKGLAYDFINFLNQPENAAQLAEYVYYATPNKAAEKLLPAEFLADPVIYPDEQTLSRCEAYLPLSARATKKRNTALARFRDR
jgi:spermidine/putrescine transport system substrate-binding protein